MWFRRLLRRPRKPPPFDLTALDRLEQQIARVVALVPQAETAQEPQPEQPPPPPPPPAPQPAPPAASPGPATAYLLFLPGYELVEGRGEAPRPGALLERDGRSYLVLRHGPSPLPDDRRRCLFLETA